MTSSDYPLTEVPQSDRKGLLSISVVLLGFTFFTATMWAGGNLAQSLPTSQLFGVILVGNLLLGIYASSLAYIACKTGLNAALIGRFCFGEIGCKLSDMILGFTQIGWYAWGTATIATILMKVLELPRVLEIPLMVFFGFAFCLTALIGYKGMDWLSRIAVPAMMIFIVLSIYKGLVDIGGLENITGSSTGEMSMTAAITVVIGTFISGGTQATNWSRFASSPKVAVLATMAAFFVGNGLMVVTGVFGALIYQHADIVDVMLAQGMMVLAVLMLFLNIWTTQDNTIYNFAVAGCDLLRTDKRNVVILAGAVIGVVLAVGGIYNFLIPYLILLGTFIPPIGGTMMADFWFKHKGEYPKLSESSRPDFNWVGLIAYAVGSLLAYTSPVLPPVVGVCGAAIAYLVLFKLSEKALPQQAK